MSQLQAQMKDTLANAGIPFSELKVYGEIKTNISVRCIGEATAKKWASLISTITGAAPHCAPSMSQGGWLVLGKF